MEIAAGNRSPRDEKQGRVREVFDSVADRYDLMNDIMSAGLHRVWKRLTVAKSGLRSGDVALDVAAGSGDLSLGLARQVGPDGLVYVTDINARMLALGRDRLINAGNRSPRVETAWPNLTKIGPSSSSV